MILGTERERGAGHDKKEGGTSMTDKQICRYTALVSRKAEIYSRYSGIHWKPEYGAELEKIDRELSELPLAP